MYFRLGDYYHLSDYYYKQMGGALSHKGSYGGDCHCGVFKLWDVRAESVEVGGDMPLDVAAGGNLTIKSIRMSFRCKSCGMLIQADVQGNGFEYLKGIQIIKILEPWREMFTPMSASSERNPNILFKMKKG